jgi:glyoxylase-like metal-dependent hydrolase (beta-lactamase superfamily II)
MNPIRDWRLLIRGSRLLIHDSPLMLHDCQMIFEVRAAPPFYKNGFIVGCERTREAVLIDPGDEVDQLLGAVQEDDVDVRCILLTHAHVDHITGVAAAREAFDVPVYLHRDDLFLYERAVEQGAMFGFKVRQPPPVDQYYDGAPIVFGGYEVLVHHTPGHCPGGVCLQIGKHGRPGDHLFVGDTLFAGSIGRTDLPGGDYGVLMRSITEVLFPLGDASIVHPGHGPDTTIGQERTTNPFVLEYLRST